MSAIRKALWLAAGLALVVTLESCGPTCFDNVAGVQCTPAPPMTLTPPPACIQSEVYTGSGPVPPLTLVFFDFPVAESGRLDLTLDWTNAPSPMGLYLVPAGTCTLDQFNQRACNFIVRSDPPGPKPRRVSANNLQAGNYRYMVANYSTASESAAYQIVLSRGSCPAVSNVPASAWSYGTSSALRVERVEER